MAERRSVGALLQEGLRLYPPGPFAVREATEDIAVCGRVIPRGSWVHVSGPAVCYMLFRTSPKPRWCVSANLACICD